MFHSFKCFIGTPIDHRIHANNHARLELTKTRSTLPN